MRLLIATTNRGKLREYRELLDGLGLELVDLNDLGITQQVPETGATFAENAALKAHEYARQSGLLTLADDSGLEVAALGGAPGVHSARFGGAGLSDAERNSLLLEQLKDVPIHDRQARFVCVIAIAEPHGNVETVDGMVSGTIALTPRGSAGFGYDPIFSVTTLDQTMAELPAQVKNGLSHRAQAAARARVLLASRVARPSDKTHDNPIK